MLSTGPEGGELNSDSLAAALLRQGFDINLVILQFRDLGLDILMHKSLNRLRNAFCYQTARNRNINAKDAKQIAKDLNDLGIDRIDHFVSELQRLTQQDITEEELRWDYEQQKG